MLVKVFSLLQTLLLFGWLGSDQVYCLCRYSSRITRHLYYNSMAQMDWSPASATTTPTTKVDELLNTPLKKDTADSILRELWSRVDGNDVSSNFNPSAPYYDDMCMNILKNLCHLCDEKVITTLDFSNILQGVITKLMASPHESKYELAVSLFQQAHSYYHDNDRYRNGATMVDIAADDFDDIPITAEDDSDANSNDNLLFLL